MRTVINIYSYLTITFVVHTYVLWECVCVNKWVSDNSKFPLIDVLFWLTCILTIKLSNKLTEKVCLFVKCVRAKSSTNRMAHPNLTHNELKYIWEMSLDVLRKRVLSNNKEERVEVNQRHLIDKVLARCVNRFGDNQQLQFVSLKKKLSILPIQIFLKFCCVQGINAKRRLANSIVNYQYAAAFYIFTVSYAFSF